MRSSARRLTITFAMSMAPAIGRRRRQWTSFTPPRCWAKTSLAPTSASISTRTARPGRLGVGLRTERELDRPLDFKGPGKVGCLGLGTGAITVIDDQTSMVDVLFNTCRFYAHESCGQCTPCREGTGWMLKIVDRIRRGQGRGEDLQILDEAAKNIGIMPGTTSFRLADGARRAGEKAVQQFRREFHAD